jgi:hypothetical protein
MNHVELDAAIEQANRIFSSRHTPCADDSSKLERLAVPTERRVWPLASLGAERRFGQPHARLFPFIGRKVWTPVGPGTLLQVFAERVTVLLDCEVTKCSCFSPGQIEPISRELE